MEDDMSTDFDMAFFILDDLRIMTEEDKVPCQNKEIALQNIDRVTSTLMTARQLLGV